MLIPILLGIIVLGGAYVAVEEVQKRQALKPPVPGSGSSPQQPSSAGTIPGLGKVDGKGTGVVDVEAAAAAAAVQEAAKAAAAQQAAQAAASAGASADQQQAAAVAAAAAVAQQFADAAADGALRASQNPDGTFVPEADAATLLLSGLPTVSR